MYFCLLGLHSFSHESTHPASGPRSFCIPKMRYWYTFNQATWAADCIAAPLSPALQRNLTVHSSGIPASEHRDREKEEEKKEERLYSALCHWQPAQELNAANPYGVQECEDGEILWQREDNISSTIWELGGSQVKTRLWGIQVHTLCNILFLFALIWTWKLKNTDMQLVIGLYHSLSFNKLLCTIEWKCLYCSPPHIFPLNSWMNSDYLSLYGVIFKWCV